LTTPEVEQRTPARAAQIKPTRRDRQSEPLEAKCALRSHENRFERVSLASTKRLIQLSELAAIRIVPNTGRTAAERRRMHDDKTNPNIHALTGELLHLPLADVVPSESNPRLNLEKEPFHELKRSIQQNGLLQPILVRPHDGRYQIIGGHRRHAAVVELARENPNEPRFARIAAVVKDVADAQLGGLQLAENLNREGLAPLEIAEAAAKAIAGGMTKEELAAALGWDTRKVYRYLQLAAAPAWLRGFAKEVKVPRQRVENGAPVVDPVTGAPVYTSDKRDGLGFTDTLELVTLYNAIGARDVDELKKNPRPDFKPQAERITRKLAYAAATEQWKTEKLRAEIKRAKETPASRAATKKAALTKPPFTITNESAFIDFKRADELTLEQREQLAAELVAALGGIGFAAVINPAAGR
jgi:ParB/RepB/Spo0J family partition protein